MTKSRPFESRFARLSTRTTTILIGALSAAFLGLVLLPALRLANSLSSGTSALGYVGEVRRHPPALQNALEATRDRLSARDYVQNSLDQMRVSTAALDTALVGIAGSGARGAFAAQDRAAALGDQEFAAAVGRVDRLWTALHALVEPIEKFSGVPYRDSETGGTQLNANGEALDRMVRSALHQTRSIVPQLDREFASMASTLQARNAASAQQLRFVMLAGLGIAAALVLLVVIGMVARSRQERLVQEAKQQTLDIMRTVKDGLFLLDEQLKIGEAYSAALAKMFRRDDLAGLTFEELLRDIVPEKTLDTAAKFVNLLWSERTNEKLIRSINPLSEVEVRVAGVDAAQEARYLEFDFHRVRTFGKVTHVLVSVADVSARVALARELEESREKSQSQLDTLLGIMHIDPIQLHSFLSDSDAAMKMINAVLKEPAREEAAFRKKLDTIFRQIHSVKGEGAALGLSSIESRAHSFEDDLQALRDKDGLSGNDLLPLVIKLDDLLTHLQSLGDLVSRLKSMQARTVEAVIATDCVGSATDVIGPGETAGGLEPMLGQLAKRLAAEHGKRVAVICTGLVLLPAAYRRMVKDIGVQAVRNAVVHGIEPVGERGGSGKESHGTIRIGVQDLGLDGYKLVIEDDGRGLSVGKIKQAAVAQKFVTVAQAESMDAKQVMGLVFRAGLTTASARGVDAGRGVGMNVIAELVQDAGGRISVSTGAGRYTRFSITLPPLGHHAVAGEAVAS